MGVFISSKSKKGKFFRANKEITANEVRLVGSKGEVIGIVSLQDAMNRALKESLDLVEISPISKPPVCKILDFSKYKYDVKKRYQESKKKQKKTSLKEMKFRPNIGQGDLDVKLRKIKKFIEDGNKVKLSLWFRGREIVHKDKGHEIFDKVMETLGELVKLEAKLKMEGKQMMMIIAPA